MIDVIKEIGRIFDEAAPPQPRIRVMLTGLCTYCDRHRDEFMMPPHHASPRCESGKRNHCTCDLCF